MINDRSQSCDLFLTKCLSNNTFSAISIDDESVKIDSVFHDDFNSESQNRNELPVFY